MTSLPSWARIGAKVVCVRAIEDMRGVAGLVVTPEIGGLYIIRAVRFGQYDAEPCVQLVEIVNARVRVTDDAQGVIWNGEPWFGLRLFRPATSADHRLKAHFHELLTIRNPQSEDA